MFLKLKSFFLFFLLVMELHSFAQDFWEQLYFPDTVSIKCISTNNQGHIFIGTGATTEIGALYRSIDNAQTWETMFNNGSLSISCIDINENGKIFLGKNGPESIVMSEDNGQTWEVADLPDVSFGNVMKIFCIGNDTIYVSLWGGNGSLITFSFDGGNSWEHTYINSESNAYASDIDMTSSGELYVSTIGMNNNTGGVYKSIDGGYSWDFTGLFNHQVYCLEINPLNEVFTGDWDSFYPEPNGIYALLEGQTEFEKVANGYHITDIAISEENEIFVTSNGSIYRSNDNGETFENIQDENSQYIKKLYIDQNNLLYGIKQDKLIRSIDPLITNINTIAKDNICIYPNPSRDYISFEGPTAIDVPYLIEITNIQGECVYSKLIQVENSYINIKDLQHGVYVFEIKNSDDFYQSKFIKQ
ncbi:MULTISPECIES: T9SS type A sorting domain-containing protein [unclassified Lentimicrobium]|uniref:T9SS type A sorting domain-containing protein n=1 Tax=unclassified Lentimicrobium TaxID=2677434 RepID=UPI001557B253|nr:MULTISPECIES: T9SS type A sorting domain-containing protein [unclassified Lentimicrobium]NPD45302.1 T9SS type A sorting domain-containing protein [Lentimicrobium sp. S6]NPD84398.1 T9SS type A sorting domain-containing protein [Lentimicrobium sp. L6]